jgi:hypothetical protein
VQLNRAGALIATGIGSLLIGIVLLAVDPQARDSSYPSIIEFEFAASEERAAEIVSEWGDRGSDAAKRSLWIDYPYIVFYGTFLVLAAAATRDLAGRRGWRRMAAFGMAAVPFAAAAAAFDAIEDVGLLLAVDGEGGDLAPGLAAVCASLKFALLAAVIAYLLVGLGLWLRSRRAAT